MTAAFFFRALLRESRGSRGRLTFFVACLSVGVAAVVAVAGLSASLDEGIRGEARQLLAADLAIDGNRPLPPGLDLATVGLAGAQRTDVRETVTIVAVPPSATGQPGSSQLAELKVIDGDYPFYGDLKLNPQRPLRELLRPDTAVAASDLLAHLHLRTGDTLRIGGQPFRIAGVVLSEPDRISISMTLGPRIFLSGEGFARTGLETRGSRVSHRTLIKLPAGAAASIRTTRDIQKRLRQALPEMVYRIQTFRDAQPSLRENISRVERFLGLVALLSLFVGGIGVAQSVRAWLAGRLDAIAVLKCLGMRPREIFPLYLGQTALLGLTGSIVGILAGAAVQLVLPSLFPDLIPAELVRPWQPGALLRGLGLGVGVALLFSLPPLSTVLRVPPARVLRREAEPLPNHRWTTVLTLVVLAFGVWAMASVQANSWDLGARFTGGVSLAAALLAGAALLVSRGVRRIQPGVSSHVRSLWLRHGLASLARPGAAAMSAIVALGLGVLVVVAMSLVERRLTAELSAELPTNAPTAFLIDIQPAQWPGVEALLHKAGALHIDSVPVVMGRLSAIDGKSVEEMARAEEAETDKLEKGQKGEDEGGRERSRRGGFGGPRQRGPGGRRRWALSREQRLTYMRELPKDNVVVAGKLWSDPDHAEVSVEQEFAENLGIGLGSTLRFDVQGVPVDLKVTSLRTVDWKTFGINFFLVVEPGVLDAAPQQRLAAVLLPKGGEQRVQDLLAASYPNVTVLRIREILEKIVKVMDRIGLGIRFLGGFTVLAGIAILAGAVSAGSARRGREVALLKTLGMTRRGVAGAFAVEYALIGFVAAAIGAGGGYVLAWGVITRGFELPWEIQPWPLVIALLAGVTLTVVAGLAASLRALERRPIEVLRAE